VPAGSEPASGTCVTNVECGAEVHIFVRLTGRYGRKAIPVLSVGNTAFKWEQSGVRLKSLTEGRGGGYSQEIFCGKTVIITIL
jgi:hypothetical protein